MTKYRVYPRITVSTSVVVEADSPFEAAEKVLDEGLPGLMFLDHTYPDEGDWDIDDNDTEEVQS